MTATTDTWLISTRKGLFTIEGRGLDALKRALADVRNVKGVLSAGRR